MQLSIALNFSASVTDAQRKSLNKYGKSLILVNTDGNVAELRGDPFIIETVTLCLYAVITGAVNYKPKYVDNVMLFFSAGCFLELSDSIIHTRNKVGGIDPRDITFISGDPDLVQVQLVSSVAETDKTFQDTLAMAFPEPTLSLPMFVSLLELVKSCNEDWNLELTDDNTLRFMSLKTGSELVVYDMGVREYLPIKLALEVLMTKKARSVVLVDMARVNADSARMLVRFFSSLDDVFVVLLNNKACVKLGQEVTRF